MKYLKNISIFVLTLFLGFTFFTAATTQNTKVVKIKGTNQMKYTVTKITAEPGQKITIKLTTVSNLPPMAMSHNFVLLKANANARKVAMAAMNYKNNNYIPPKMKDKIIAHTGLASGGETVTVTFTAPEEPGKYPYICTFPGHFLGGMKGTLVVK